MLSALSELTRLAIAEFSNAGLRWRSRNRDVDGRTNRAYATTHGIRSSRCTRHEKTVLEIVPPLVVQVMVGVVAIASSN